MYKIPIVLVLTILNAGISKAEIIDIPDDEETIQAGIRAAEDGDTVLVHPGEYSENLFISNVNITLGSLLLVDDDEDEDYASETIINGGRRNSALIVSGVNDVQIVGITIHNGISQDDGGGISCTNSILTVSDCIITENSSGSYGGGVYCSESNLILNNCEVSENSGGGIGCELSNAELNNCIVVDNSSQRRGAGLYSYGSSLTISESVISGNETGNNGGAIYTTGADNELTITDCEIINNSSSNGTGAIECRYVSLYIYGTSISDNVGATTGGIHYYRGDDCEILNSTICNNISEEEETGGLFYDREFTMTNSILWGNEPNQVHEDWDVNVSITWSDIEHGWDGEGNIEQDPLFVNPWDGDFHLTNRSPCIDAGNPEDDPDPDSSRVDMGAFPFYQRGVIEGFVVDHQNDLPLEGALVLTSYGASATSDEAGYWNIVPISLAPFDITASMIGYFDSTMVDKQVEYDDTLTLTFNLLHAELEPSIDAINSTLDVGDIERIDFSISNPGNRALEWTAETRYRGDAGFDPWTLRESYPFGEQLEDGGLYGVVFTDDHFYVSGSNRGRDEGGNYVSSPTIYLLSDEGALIDTFAQPGEDHYGMKDLAFDGELIWGVVDNSVYGLSLEGEIINSFYAPYNPSSAITWDPDRELFWICGATSNPVGMDRDGNRVEGMEIDRDRLRVYGMAYFPEDSDSAPLYIFHKERETNRQTVVKYNFETEETIFVTHLIPEDGGFPQGSFITNQYDGYSWVFASVANNADLDRVDIWQLEANVSWALIDPEAGDINPDADQDIAFTIDATDLAPIEYPAEMIFSHNGIGLETRIPVDLIVTPLSINSNPESMLASKFTVTAAYPNPFNSTIRLSYNVPRVSQVSIKLYDLTGSLVEEIASGDHQPGHHSAIWDASAMPSGIYFARMEADNYSQAVKLMLMK